MYFSRHIGDLLFTSAGPFITSKTTSRRFIDSTSTKTKSWKLSKKSEANQEATFGPYSSKQTVITVLKNLPYFSFCFSLILNFFNKVFSFINKFKDSFNQRNVINRIGSLVIFLHQIFVFDFKRQESVKLRFLHPKELLPRIFAAPDLVDEADWDG